ncbi:MAG TPA: NAD(P)-binding domain-containing protein, partial [Anseongella sp.]
MDYDVIIIGGGQSALACGYFLRRTKLSFVLLDDQEHSGGAWLHAWDSLTLFSPAEYSSLPGWLMPASQGKFPSKEEVINYLMEYEHKYRLPVERPVKVHAVNRVKEGFSVETSKGTIQSKAVLSATGTWQQPFIPELPGRDHFHGKQLHSAFYSSPFSLKGRKVLVIGEGNSGAQLLAEISKVADIAWS